MKILLYFISLGINPRMIIINFIVDGIFKENKVKR